MRILFSSAPQYGHTYPLLPLAIAAREAGHEISYAIDVGFHPLVRRLGFRPVRAGVNTRAGAAKALQGQAPPPPNPSWRETIPVAVHVFTEAVFRPVAADLLPLLREDPVDLVVYEPGNPGAALVAHHLGIPAVCHGFSRASLLSDDFQAMAADRVRGAATQVGLTVPDAAFPTFGDPYIDVYPPSLQEPSFLDEPARVPLRPTAFAEPGELPAVVRRDRDRPLVYLTLGTAVGTVPPLRAAIEGLSRLDIDLLVAAGPAAPAGELGDLPGNVHVEAWLPQADVMPHLDLAVHHGGSGTTLSAAAAGVPQLFLPVLADHFVNGNGFAAAGAGTWLLPEGTVRFEDRRRNDAVAAPAIAAAAEALLADPEATKAAQRVASEIAEMPGPAQVAARLPGLAR
ncbi:glycosyltransferase [Polymorphospora sp. NPDC051019]|uniref:glycosyltransferase n=1 Tax=Polymorphospora sp. NPDC051019 TaxID=3155725 RepID=UPI00343851F6